MLKSIACVTDPHLNLGLSPIIDPKNLRRVILFAMTKAHMEIVLSFTTKCARSQPNGLSIFIQEI